jgi:hypothetical protein
MLLQMTSDLQEMLQDTYYQVASALEIHDDMFVDSYVYYANLQGDCGDLPLRIRTPEE